MSPFVRKVRTASGATAVQIAEKHHGVRRILEHLGSAHTEADLAVLMQVARDKLNEGQQVLDIELPGTESAPAASGAVVTGSAAQVLWEVLTDAYALLGFDVLDDEAFRSMVLARIIEPASKLATTGILAELGVEAPHRNTLMAALVRCQERDYRGVLATACMSHTTKANGAATMVLYDTTTLHFEAEDEDDLRRVGMSKERRVDPQVQVGLLVDPGGFPLEVHLFEGNKAETTTLVPVLRQFQHRHGIADMVVVADAGMLSAANLNALEDAGYSFIVGSRIAKAPYDLAAHFERHGNNFADGQTLESVRTMGTGAKARDRRVVYHYSFRREKRDNYTLNKQIEKAEKVASGQRPLKKDRFVKLAGKKPGVDWDLVERARQLLGLKGYVTNLPVEKMPAANVVAAYHDLWQVEASFRMTKSDLRARPVFHRTRQAIEAHLTVVFAALAISRHLQDITGVSIKKLIRTLRPLRSVTIEIDGHTLTAAPTIGTEAREILDMLPAINAPGH
ncbi:IS1634 family transposase [Citricoccus sp. NPDC055426]|uniref:IS1634 family transposase n=1 Tax=Citricoccus sp. NPDC055426 TaxID=3155536 RepID=UPI003422F2D3